MNVAVVGASVGIGRAIAESELQAGIENIVLVSRPGTKLDNCARLLTDQYGADKVHKIACDLLADPDTPSLVNRLDSLDIRFDRLYLNVGGGPVANFAEQSALDFELALDINLKAQSRALRAFLEYLPARSVVVSVNSVAGFRTFPGWSAYCAAKWGLRAWIEALREEFRAQEIRFCSAHPYATDTDYWDSVGGDWDRSKMMSAEEVAATIVHAAKAPVVVEEIRFASAHGAL